jgi:hypothetical protein
MSGVEHDGGVAGHRLFTENDPESTGIDRLSREHTGY